MTEDELDDLYMKDPRAKTVEGFIAGLTLLAAHMPNGLSQKFAFGGGHEEIFIWGDVTLDAVPRDSEEGHKLIALGFHADEDLDQWSYFT